MNGFKLKLQKYEQITLVVRSFNPFGVNVTTKIVSISERHRPPNTAFPWHKTLRLGNYSRLH